MDTLAEIKVVLGLLLGGYGQQSQITRATVEAYVDAVKRYPFPMIVAAYEDFRDRKVPGHDYRFAPSAPDFAERVRLRVEVAEIEQRRALPPAERPAIVSYRLGGQPPEGYEPLGHTGNKALVA